MNSKSLGSLAMFALAAMPSPFDQRISRGARRNWGQPAFGPRFNSIFAAKLKREREQRRAKQKRQRAARKANR